MKPPREPLTLVHHHPGRLRVRADVFVRDVAAFERVREALALMDGVEKATHNPVAGSVLITYQPGRCDVDEVLDRVAEAAGLGEVIDEVEARARRAGPAVGVIRAVRSVDEAVRAVGSERVGLAELVPAALAATAVVSAAMTDRKALMPRWDSLLWWSYSVFRDWHARAIDDARHEQP